LADTAGGAGDDSNFILKIFHGTPSVVKEGFK
jgi:hypothetical protein